VKRTPAIPPGREVRQQAAVHPPQGVAGAGPRADLIQAIERRYGVRATGWRRVRGGDESVIWRLESAAGEFVLRISPPWRKADDLRWTHEVARFVAQDLPEAVAPLTARDGSSLFPCGEGSAAVFPFVPGRAASRRRPAERVAAARFLARLHVRLRAWPAGRPAPRAAPHDAVAGEPPVLNDRELETWRRALERGPGPTRGLVHGDFYRRNLRWRDGRITGLIDWDDAHLDFVMQEVAWAACEWAKSAAGDDLDPEAALTFLHAYRSASGPVGPNDPIPFIRWRLREEIRANLLARSLGRPWDPVHVQAELRAFERLRAVRALEG
jgi:Ser/Thr protein kinase RdoA (MazF antagonist)